jgi:dienelactone hydrolase
VQISRTASAILMFTAALLLAANAEQAGARAEARVPGTGPWDLKQLRKAPPYTLGDVEELRERIPGEEGEVSIVLRHLRYTGEPWQGKPTTVFAWYARPAGTVRRLPGMVLVHGGGGRAFPQWARMWAARGYAAVAMDLRGNGPTGERLPDGGPDLDDEWAFHQLKAGLRNCWSYHAVAAVLRAASVLQALPEVDDRRLGITGISWGGYVTAIAMSLDDRFKVAVPVYGCGALAQNSVWKPIFDAMPARERDRWVENFDPLSYLPRRRLPVLWVNGTNDFAYPLDSWQKSYRAMPGRRALCLMVRMGHSHEHGWAPVEIARFVESVLRPASQTPPPPIILGAARQGRRIYVAYEAGRPLRGAQVHYTTDLHRPWAEREWITVSASIRSLHEVEAELPATAPLIYFVTLTDMGGAVGSTEHEEVR